MSLPAEIHPEFGYLAPTPQFRRVLRIAGIAAAMGAVFGAVSVLALGARHDRVAATAEPAELAQADSAAWERGGVLPAATASIAQPTATAKPCSEQARPDLERKCRSGNSRRWRHVRVVPVESPAAVEPAVTASVGNETVTPPQPAALPTKPRKTASKRPRSRNRGREYDEFDPGNAYAASAGAQPDWRDWREPEGYRSRRQQRQDRLDGGSLAQPDPWRRSRDGWSW